MVIAVGSPSHNFRWQTSIRGWHGEGRSWGQLSRGHTWLFSMHLG